jgi:hypothetical protein
MAKNGPANNPIKTHSPNRRDDPFAMTRLLLYINWPISQPTYKKLKTGVFRILDKQLHQGFATRRHETRNGVTNRNALNTRS